MGELQATYLNEEVVVCFIKDVAKLDNLEVQKLLSWYRLSITTGENFQEQYDRVQARMKNLAEQERQNAEKQPTPETKVGQTAEKKADAPKGN